MYMVHELRGSCDLTSLLVRLDVRQAQERLAVLAALAQGAL
jgi:hypothetical protein